MWISVCESWEWGVQEGVCLWQGGCIWGCTGGCESSSLVCVKGVCIYVLNVLARSVGGDECVWVSAYGGLRTWRRDRRCVWARKRWMRGHVWRVFYISVCADEHTCECAYMCRRNISFQEERKTGRKYTKMFIGIISRVEIRGKFYFLYFFVIL